ncbi:MAG: cytochrome P450 [Ilumatobacteraceae bacterium]
MTIDETIQIENPTGCPITHFHEVNTEAAPAGWHFDNFDIKREQAPVHTGVAGPAQYFLITRMADIRASFQNASVLSNSAVVPADPNPMYRWIPEMLDGREHTAWRHLTGPFFSPSAVAALETSVRARFAEVLDSVAGKGSCDFVQDVALLFPNVIFMDLFGLPRDDAETFQRWEVDILHGGHSTEEGEQRRVDAMTAVMGYFGALIADRRANPDPSRNDILSQSLSWEIDGSPISDQDLLDFCLLMFMAGLDTVAAQLTFSWWHLATHDADRRRIVNEPELIPTAIEEFLRYYSFVTPGRKVVTDTEIAGCPIKAGQMVYLPLVSGNRDPREFPDADKVVIDRESNRHLAFGGGPHRCLGSSLARQELRVAMEMWHERIPDYRIAPGAEIREHGGQVGIDSLPLVWDV